MKKALWSIVSYPDSSDIKSVIDTLVGAGAQCMYVLHDKDTKNGQPIKPHYHIACGWETGAPTWTRFTQILASVGAVCPGKRGRFDPEQAKVNDPDSLEDYWAHEDEASLKAGKYDYGKDAIIYTDGWNLAEYVTYTAKRKTAKSIRNDELKERAADFAFFCDLCREKDIMEYSTLCDLVRSAYPDKFGAFVQNSYAIKTYIDSVRGYASTVARDRERELAKQLRDLSGDYEELQKKHDDLKRRYHITLCAIIAQYAKATGETPPEWWETSVF